MGEPRAQMARLSGVTGMRLRLVAGIAVGVAAAALAGCGTAAGPAGLPRARVVAGPVEPAGSFLTVATSAQVVRDVHPGWLEVVRYPVATLQLRSVRTGRVIAALLHSLGGIDAVMSGSGLVVAVVDYGCRSQVLRVDPQTGNVSLIRVLPQSATSVALSPDGRQLAYVTYPGSDPRPCTPGRQPASPVRVEVNPGGPAGFLPNVVGVVNLSSGATVRAATSNPGDPPVVPAWSPDGTRIAVTDMADNSIVLLSASHPDFASAPRIHAPPGCGYAMATWTVAGLVAVAGCGPGPQEPFLSPQRLVQLSTAGQPTARWRLPGCIDGIRAFADATFRHVLVQADIGYGNGPPCGRPQAPGLNSTHILAVRGAALDTIAVFPQGSTQLQVSGW
jgi:hypothetical protein